MWTARKKHADGTVRVIISAIRSTNIAPLTHYSNETSTTMSSIFNLYVRPTTAMFDPVRRSFCLGIRSFKWYLLHCSLLPVHIYRSERWSRSFIVDTVERNLSPWNSVRISGGQFMFHDHGDGWMYERRLDSKIECSRWLILSLFALAVPIEQKKFVFITARIHPGETNSSFMMRGLLEFITSDDKIAKVRHACLLDRTDDLRYSQQLRSQLVFKIVPMLNPDGVIIGNYRCSLTGKDMNRNFRHPRKQSFPTIYHIKQLMQTLQKENREVGRWPLKVTPNEMCWILDLSLLRSAWSQSKVECLCLRMWRMRWTTTGHEEFSQCSRSSLHHGQDGT